MYLLKEQIISTFNKCKKYVSCLHQNCLFLSDVMCSFLLLDPTEDL